jgi:hypothetical protein
MADSTFQIVGKFSGIDQMVGGFERLDTKVKEVTKSIIDQVGATGKLGQAVNNLGTAGKKRADLDNQHSQQRQKNLKEEASVLDRAIGQMDRYRHGIQEATGAWAEQFDSLHGLMDAGEGLARAQTRWQALNLGATDTARGLQAVNDVVQQIRGTELTGMTESLIDLHTGLGNVGEAIEFLPEAGKIRSINSILFGSDPHEVERNILMTMKAIEQLGGIKLEQGHPLSPESTARFKEYLNVAEQLQVLTGGRVGGAELQQFAARSGMAGMGITPEALLKMGYAFTEMGGAQAGTALMSQFQAFVAFRQASGGGRSIEALGALGLLKDVPAGASPKHVAAILQREGLAEISKEGRIRRIKPGAFPAADTLADDPFAFAQVMKDAIAKNAKYVMGHPVDVTNAAQLAAVLSQVVGSRTAMNELGKFMIQSPQTERDFGIARNLGGIDDILARLGDTPMARMARFQASWQNFQQQVGLPLLDTLTKLAERFQPIFAFIEKHPEVASAAADFMLLKVALGGVAGTLQGFRTMGLLGGLTRQLESEGAKSTAYSKWLGGRIGAGISYGLAAALAGYSFEKIIQGWEEQGEATSRARKASDQLGVLGSQRVAQEHARYRFSAVPGLPGLADMDRQIGALRVAQGQYDLVKHGLFGHDSQFAADVKILDASTGGGVGKWLAEHLGQGSAALYRGSGVGYGKYWKYGSDQEARRAGEVERLRGEHFESAQQLEGFLGALKATGKYSENEMNIIKQLAGTAYPSFDAQLKLTGEDAKEAGEGLQGLVEGLAGLVNAKPPEWWHGPWTGPPTSHLPGGKSPFDYFNKDRWGNTIGPHPQGPSFPAPKPIPQSYRVGGGHTFHMPITVHATGASKDDADAIADAVMVRVEEELPRMMNEKLKDRSIMV